MPTPIREQILQAITTRVSGTRGLEQYDEQDLPFTVVIESDDTAEESDYDFVRVTMPVTIGRAKKVDGNKSDDWYTQGNTDLADVIKEVYAGGDDLGGLADGIDYTGGSVDVLTDGARGVIVQAFFNVRFTFLHGNPYSQTL